MTTYQKGSSGDAVRGIQTALTAHGYNIGVVDGIFGGGTDAAVRAFQRADGLQADGIVGAKTWAALMTPAVAGAAAVQGPVEPPEPTVGDGLLQRCVGLTGSFETSTPVPDCFSGVTGNFDGQGLSFGALQQCLGQGSLQPLLKRMVTAHEPVIAQIFGSDFNELTEMLDETNLKDQVSWAASKQTPRYNLTQPWLGYLRALGRTAEYQAIQADAAQAVYNRGLEQCRRFGLLTERAAALMFDIITQNGSISNAVAAQIQSDFQDPGKVPPGSDETAKLVVIANRRAEASNPAYVEDVRCRKLTIAQGGGIVHGMTYDLAKGYGIRLIPADDLKA